jgi:peptidase E
MAPSPLSWSARPSYPDPVPKPRQIFAYSGILRTEAAPEPRFGLVQHAIDLAGSPGRPRVCFVPTAVGDSAEAVESFASAATAAGVDAEITTLALFPQPSVPDIRAHLLGQDVIVVSGGSVANLMAVWRVHGLREIMRDCWEAGVVLSGGSAGSLCWHLGGPTDSFRDELDPFTDGIGLLPYSNGVHDDFAAQPRRDTYRRMVADGTFPAGYASEDGVGLHYLGTELHEAVRISPGKRGWHVAPDGSGGWIEEELPTRDL